MSQETSIVERLYDALVEEVSQSRPELLHESFTVAEIYQNLIPYRTHRERVGAEMNGDYEHALLRLLAGEGGYVTLESDVARSRLEEELNSIHPDTGVYRNFAACEVRLQPEPMEGRGVALDLEGPPVDSDEGEGVGEDRTDESHEDAFEEEEKAGGPGSMDAGDLSEGSPGEPGGESEAPSLGAATDDAHVPLPSPEAPTEDSEAEEPEAAASGGEAVGVEDGSQADEDAEGDSTASDGPGTCLWCRETLPDREDLRFCPFCGSSVEVRPCPDCGAEVESDWIFCIACGAEAAG